MNPPTLLTAKEEEEKAGRDPVMDNCMKAVVEPRNSAANNNIGSSQHQLEWMALGKPSICRAAGVAGGLGSRKT
jgi:hypothetical protein